jgi:hypothetical protein
MSLSDRAAAAGAITSRIDQQDAAAALLALRLLAGENVFGIKVQDPSQAVLHCEGRDDLELVTTTTRCLISVKTKSAEVELIADEYSRLTARSFGDSTRNQRYALVIIGPQPAAVATFANQLEQAKFLVEHRDAIEANEVYAGFSARWPQVPQSVINHFYIALDIPTLQSKEYQAVAVRLLRQIAPLTDYTDTRANFILSELDIKFRNARLSRSSVTLTEVRDAIFSFVVPREVVTLADEYVRTRYGYLPHPQIKAELEREKAIARSAIRYALQRYRRATRKHRMLGSLIGPIKCIACNGPLMANWLGWGSRGIACSHCGFAPYISLFYACTCGRPILLVAQPPIDILDTAISIRRAANTVRCQNCGQSPRLERLETRVFRLSIPWPPENVSDKGLIEARKEFGWSTAKFRDGKTNAAEKLLEEGLNERIEHRLPYRPADD